MALLPALSPGAAQAGELPVWGYLDNGMGYLLLESHAAPLIGSSVIVHSGSAREDFETNGASHLLEHLLFNGTESRTQEQLYDDVDAIGGYNNATTRRTHVAYMMLTPAEKIREGLEIQADMLLHSTLPPEKLEKERGIILEELAKDRDAGDFELERQLRLAAFGPTGAGLPILGSELSIESMSRETVLGFYKTLYTPRNMTLLVVGDFGASEMERLIQEIFGHEPPGPDSPRPAPQDWHWDGQSILFEHDRETVVLEWTAPGPDPARADFLAHECLVDLLCGDDASRLNRALKELFGEKILSAQGWIEMLPHQSYLHYRIEADRSVEWEELAATVREIANAPQTTPTAEDVAAWKVARETEEYFLREKPHFYAIYRGEHIAAQGIDGIVDLAARLDQLTPEMVQETDFGLRGSAHRLAVGLPRAVAEADTAAPLAAGIMQTTLDNGTELLILSSPESPVLALHLFVRGRSEVEPEGMDGAVELIQSLMTVRTTKSDSPTLQRKIRSIGAQLKTADNPHIPYDDFYSTHSHSYIRLQSLDRYADATFALLAELLGPPAWTDQDFEEQRQSMLAIAGRTAGSSGTTARTLVREALYGGTPRAHSVFATPAALRAMTADSLRAAAQRYFVGERFLLVVATSLDPATIAQLAAEHLGGMPRGARPAELPSRAALDARIRSSLPSSDAIPDTIAALTLPDSTWLRAARIDASQARLTWVLPLGAVPEADFPAIELWNAALSAAIQFQLRETEGLAYSIGSSVEQLDDGSVVWTASAGTRLPNLPRVLEGFQQQLARALATPPDSATVERQGYQMYGRSLMRRATRMNRAYAAGMAVLERRDPAGIDDEIRAPTLVTAGQIRDLLATLRAGGPGFVAIAY